jgi:uncharacterized protein YdhG (YjbR/CyaY superfamily)
MDPEVQDYVEAIDAEHRPLFDRVHRLVLEEHPEAEVVLSYKMPTYVVGGRRVHVGVWKHGVSIYGWDRDHDGGFTAAHPDLVTSKGTIRLGTADAASVGDDELRRLFGAALT